MAPSLPRKPNSIAMLEKPYRIVGSTKHEACVVKLKYEDKYVIIKCKNSFTTLKAVENGLNSFLRGGKNNPAGFHFHLYNHIKEHPGGKIKVEYLSPEAWNDPYKLLVIEQQRLDDGRNDPNMLNNQRDAYIPPYDEATGLYGWISPGAVLNFRNWLKRRKKARKTAG
jgi:hypothetical protein